MSYVRYATDLKNWESIAQERYGKTFYILPKTDSGNLKSNLSDKELLSKPNSLKRPSQDHFVHSHLAKRRRNM